MGNKSGNKRNRLWKRLAVAASAFLLLIFAAAIIVLFPVLHVEKFGNLDPAKLMVDADSSTLMYDGGNKLIGEYKQPVISYADIPSHTVKCFIASEDKRFYDHKGVDYKRLAGAAWKDIKSGSAKEGGSTISQQVVKNTHLSNEKTVRRKLEEVKLAKQLERKYSKESILEIYLNKIFFGGRNYGIEAASQNYFGKSAKELTLSESAMLAGIIPSPNTYSPAVSLEKAVSRRDLVLKVMQAGGYITEDEYNAALAETIGLKPGKLTLFSENNYLSAALFEAADLAGVNIKEFSDKNYRIHTYMDTGRQKILENAIAGAPVPANENGKLCDSLGILIDNKTGGVCAFYGKSRYDLRAIKRQPASAIKPVLVYAPALDNNTVSEGSAIMDEPYDFNGYRPENYNGKYLGQTTIRHAVETSSNTAAVKVLEYEGIQYARAAAEKFGIEFAAGDDSLALALGGFTYGVTPLSLAGAYSAFPRGGSFLKPAFVRAVYNPSGALIYRRNEADAVQAVGSDTAYIMTDILRGTARTGTAKKLSSLKMDVAAKTGTAGADGGRTNNDAYCISYTSAHTLTVWMGNSEGTPEYALKPGLTGGGLPAVISRGIYESIYDTPPPPFVRPQSVTEIDGKLYAARFAPAPPATMPDAENSGAPQLLPKDILQESINAAEKETRHTQKYDELKNASVKKKESFIERFKKRFRLLTGKKA